MHTPRAYLLYHKNAIIKPMIAWNSIRAKAMIIGVKTLSADVGLRAIPDNAASAALPWEKVPPKAARPMAKLEPIATQPDVSPPSLANARELTKKPPRTAKKFPNLRFINYYPAYKGIPMVINGHAKQQERYRYCSAM